MNKISKTNLEFLLNQLQKMGNTSTKDNRIDMDKMKNDDVFKAVITLLKANGINGQELRRRGYIPAFMLLTSFLKDKQ